MSTISASTTSTTAYKVAADTTGTLVLQTGATPTTALTLGTDQSATFAGTVNAPNTFGFKNRIINGAMMIDQRNAHGSFTVGTGATAYEADRWFVYSSGGQTFGNTNTDTSLSGFSYSMTIAPQTGATNVLLNQRIESYNIADCAGQNVTLSFWIYTSGLSGTSSYVQPYTPTAQDNYSSGTYGSSQTISYTNGSWVKNTFTFSTSNGGMNANYGLAILFNFVSAVGAIIKITGVQLEKGSTATSFDYRPYGTELALCYRYYRRFISTNTYTSIGVGVTGNATQLNRWGFTLDTPMRTAPTPSFNSCIGWNSAVGGAVSVGSNYSTTNNIDCDLITSGLSNTAGFAAKVLMSGTSAYVELTGAEL